jgi:hypothetical protein
LEAVIEELIYGYVRDRQLCTRAAFASKHPHPVLVFRQTQASAAPETQEIPALGPELEAAVRMMRHEAHQYRVFALKKPKLTVGRASNSDLRLASGSVSKVHAHLESVDGRYALVDHGSRNGSKVGARKLEPDRAVTLSDGDSVHFGHVQATYLSPAGLFDFLSTLLDPRATPGG